ncbi:urea ABC transporter ATP-binding protein UrtD [Atrimonas thermophila]|uniref:urea ABC transporter ATP-binding protein UrtD n=1 Tax=Atrimonas thermophila TaxID=3064161 RepID=UPI00399C6C3C
MFLLEVEEIVVSFDGFRALNGVSLALRPREIRVLIGPNGAGKSTLLDAIIGRVRPCSGRIVFKGQEITHLPEYSIVRLGIGRKFQAPGILENLTVLENLILAVKSAMHKGSLKELLTSRISIEEEMQARAVLEEIGLVEKQDFPAGLLPHGEKQWLEIGMVVAMQPELILLDEPTAGMTVQETEKTADLIHRLADRHAILVIDHDMAFVELLEAPITVLHMGRVLCEGTVESVRKNPEVVSVYLGRDESTREEYACSA